MLINHNLFITTTFTHCTTKTFKSANTDYLFHTLLGSVKPQEILLSFTVIYIFKRQELLTKKQMNKSRDQRRWGFMYYMYWIKKQIHRFRIQSSKRRISRVSATNLWGNVKRTEIPCERLDKSWIEMKNCYTRCKSKRVLSAIEQKRKIEPFCINPLQYILPQSCLTEILMWVEKWQLDCLTTISATISKTN